MTKAALGIAAGICGTLIIGYCIYFDRKRRSDPDFRKKLRERRKVRKAQSGKPEIIYPDMRDHAAVQQFFLEQVQKGEDLLAQGDFEAGVEHLGNAIAVCGQPNELLRVLQQTLPPRVFQLLINRLPVLTQKMSSAPCGGSSMAEDDVE